MEFIPEMQGWYNISKSINVIHYTNRFKNKGCIIILINAFYTFEKNEHTLMIQMLNKLDTEEINLSIMKVIYEKPTA